MEEIKEGKEKEQLAQNAQIEVKNKKKRTAKKLKRAIAIVTSIIVACVVSLIVLFTVIIPKVKYNKAMTLLESGEYESAYMLLEELGKNDVITSNKYDRAVALVDSCEYEAASELLEEIDASYRYDKALVLIDSGKYEHAYMLLKDLNYKNSADILESIRPQCKELLLSIAQVGDYVLFGSYEQDNNYSNGKEDIEWLVLAKEGNRMLLISRYGLDCQEYHTTTKLYDDVTWETCSVRKWLNGIFISSAFSSDEQAIIQSTTVTADKNPEYSTSPGKNTTDKVFLLSITEANKYFNTDSARQCRPTEYAGAKGADTLSLNGNCWWWLRSPGMYSNTAADVPDDGSITYFGNFVYSDGFAVRPALWVELKSNDSNTGLGNDVIDGQEGSDSTDSTDTSRYIVGETYTVQTNLRVRKGPGKEYGILKRSELTSEDYAKSVDTKTDAVIAKGSRITCLEMSGNWMRISSGWVCVEDEGEILVK
ncbi:MAG: hypothetical protein IK026_03460 [Eubacteriaceae bacterium]|nr:hypothetical protein [Eubacteriaceae bacterium]